MTLRWIKEPKGVKKVFTIALNNLLAILWICLFLKNKKENKLQVTNFLLLTFAIGILINSFYSAVRNF
ncbi:hypothetical protein BTO28_12640 [Domibacillus epiphyticus]|uniref:Uncharacterized protein n=1 Tax=Domibacillus epiphyticus TaxID=1714355 RepID=A0A1V2A5V5_9BACI|nr:hypothetical protein BTO28_12640 [Domibacillus epiphyticus]